MVMIRQNPDLADKLSVILGVLVALAAVLVTLRFASWCSRYLRPSAIHFFTRILGLLLTAIAVQLVVSAIARWSRLGLDI
jgi:small neutral amino acid transporter SnatA (MarC family)